MANKIADTKKDVANIFGSMRDGISQCLERTIPDIITFVNDPEWLGLGLDLYPIQQIALKCFYRGSVGNENLTLNKAELNLLKRLGCNTDNRGNVLQKYENGETFKDLVLIWGRRCISENMTIINPKDGSINKIGDLWSSGIKNIDSWTFNEKSNKMEIIKNADIIFQGERECYKVTTNNGFEIEATSNHPFLTERGWVNLSELDISKDKIAICESVPFFGNSLAINEHEASLLGYITGDGCCSQDTIYFTCDNEKILLDIENNLNNISNNLRLYKDVWTGARSKDKQYKISSKKIKYETFYHEEKERKITRRKKNDLMKLLIKWGLQGKTCHEKNVPLELFKCPKNVISAYLKALFSCDGNLGARNGATFEFTTVNQKQAKLIQQLLQKFGIISNLRGKKVNSKIEDEKGIIREYNSKCYIIHFSRKKYIEIFLDEINFIGKTSYVKNAESRLSDINKEIKTNHLDNHPFSFLKIKSIKNMGTKKTFDLSVSHNKNLQNFTAQGFIIHNSGKDFVTSIIALYEVMKLLECPGGDPYAMYELGDANTINIITIANSQEQAKLAFSEMRAKLLKSKYFRDKFLPDGFTSNSLYLLTPKDREENIERKAKKYPLKKGSIGLVVGHSNSDSLLGMGCIVLLLDEVATYKNADKIYQAMMPTIATYNRREYVIDANGNFIYDEFGMKEVHKTHYDGKIISISSPRGKEGKFYNLYKTAPETANRLMMRLATWEVTPQRRKELRKEFAAMTEGEFNMEFGAEFSGIGLENFFSEDQVNSCFTGHNYNLVEMGRPGGFSYFAHFDPATSSHNYALVILHKEFFMNPETKKADFVVIVDHVKYWHPSEGKALDVFAITDYLIKLKRRFRLGLITYDQFSSQECILKLRKASIPNKLLRFNRSLKMSIYKELENLINGGRLIIPCQAETELLRQEMIELRRKFDAQGFKVMPMQDGDGAKTDDIVDCLAGACYSAIEKQVNRLPHGKTVNTGITPQANNQVWRNMQGGVQGVGPGQQVARQLENRSQAYRNRSYGR